MLNTSNMSSEEFIKIWPNESGRKKNNVLVMRKLKGWAMSASEIQSELYMSMLLQITLAAETHLAWRTDLEVTVCIEYRAISN